MPVELAVSLPHAHWSYDTLPFQCQSLKYILGHAISQFFAQTRTIRGSSERKAQDLVGGTIVAVEVQGVCSYTVYAGPDLQYVVQFRLESLKLSLDIATLARQIFLGLWYQMSSPTEYLMMRQEE
ncbi:hypothetical protein J1614_001988 [Plenodomus biglobosus]|nr:hypothetical protein J1614_001988 [Plenodomus biglobosus]